MRPPDDERLINGAGHLTLPEQSHIATAVDQPSSVYGSPGIYVAGNRRGPSWQIPATINRNRVQGIKVGPPGPDPEGPTHLVPRSNVCVRPMRTAPLVSVVCAAYNRGPAIQMTIDSVLAQTVTDFELIVVSDGSSDETDATVRSASRADGRSG